MKYKVGDKVRVRDDLVIDNDYGDSYVSFTSDMAYYKGQVVTISEVGDYFYKIKEDSLYNWSWVDEMFEDVSDDIKSSEITVKNLLDKTLLELGGFIVSIVNSRFEVSMGNNYIKRDTELYKRFIMAYGDMVIKNVSVDVYDNHRKLIIYVED